MKPRFPSDCARRVGETDRTQGAFRGIQGERRTGMMSMKSNLTGG